MSHRIARPIARLLSLGLLALLTATACTPPSSDSISGEPEAGLTAEPETAITPDNPDAVEEPDATDDAVAAQSNTAVSAGVALASDGVILVVGDSGSTRSLPFGTDMSTATDVLTNIWGEPVSVANDVLCEPSNQSFDSVTWDNGVTIDGLDGEFVGWRTQDDNVTTMNGVSVGTSLAELKNSYGEVETFEDPLGINFYTSKAGPGIAGLLSSAEADAAVTYLSAGDQCVYR